MYSKNVQCPMILPAEWTILLGSLLRKVLFCLILFEKKKMVVVKKR